MALHYACTPVPYAAHDFAHHNSSVVQEIHRRWLRKGYIVPASEHEAREYGSEYVATEALTVWTEALMQVPPPALVERWEIPRS